MPEPLLIGWEEIHKLFCLEDGTALISISTLQQKYGPELKELGIVFQWRRGRAGRIMMGCWPSKIKSWWTRKQQLLYERNMKPWDCI